MLSNPLIEDVRPIVLESVRGNVFNADYCFQICEKIIQHKKEQPIPKELEQSNASIKVESARESNFKPEISRREYEPSPREHSPSNGKSQPK